MPRGTERKPGPYALDVAAAVMEIAKRRGLSNRALAAQMGVGEKYIRDRFKKTATMSFTVTDIERFSGLAGLTPEYLLNDPTGTAASYGVPSMSEGGAIVTDIERKRAKVAQDPESAEKKASLDNKEMNQPEDD